MSLAESMLREFEIQVPITRRFLERLPEDKLSWKPHQKSMSAGQLALHIALVPGGVVRGAQQNPAQAPDFGNIPQPSNLQEVLTKFDESIATVKSVLPQFDDAGMQETWRLMQGDRELLATPRAQFLRDIMLNHWYQHRGQFGVYLRLLNVAVPASWGPSADEPPKF
ncbi:MAG TPA: DinB family protein [Edaphobacter sp.]|nr:DinB family protein [Edaphobacter sp.]